MSSNKKISLLQDFFDDKLNDKQLKELFYWLNSKKGTREYEELFKENWLTGKSEDSQSVGSSQVFEKIERQISKKRIAEKKRFYNGIRNAAAIFILGLVLPIGYYNATSALKKSSQLTYFQQTLSNEKVKKLMLADGTNVWLMSGSSVTYPSSFSGTKTRNIKVRGEAFFDVAKDSSHPFIVDLGEVSLKVVGTSFDVMNYGNDDQIKIALKTGKIELFNGEYDADKQFVQVSPGQLATFKKDKSGFTIEAANIEKYTSWTDGTLLFHDDPLAEVLKRLGKWYNVNVEMKDSAANDFPFTATVKNENLDQIIDLLTYSTPFKYTKITSSGETKLIIEKKMD